jgi:hypothetical protein
MRVLKFLCCEQNREAFTDLVSCLTVSLSAGVTGFVTVVLCLSYFFALLFVYLDEIYASPCIAQSRNWKFSAISGF